MTQSRREAMRWGLRALTLGGLPAGSAAYGRARLKRRRTPRSYTNPVLAGDHPDPAVLKVGDHYYATFTSFVYYPGATIWKSADLIAWTPVGAALRRPLGSVYAMDLTFHGGRYFLYVPAHALDGGRGAPFTIYVLHAPSPEGPWSEPTDLGVHGFIDPHHVVDEKGKRHLFLNKGHIVPLRDDGLAADGPAEKVYDGWRHPKSWVLEGDYLEGPKVLKRDGYFYLFSADGGTAGPPTSHYTTVARSRSLRGPWEECPHNPIVRTTSRSQPWWSRGHATPVEGPDGRWWLAYHGIRNGFRTLGREMLLEPTTWDAAGWPRARGGDLSTPFPRPAGSGSVRGADFADDFTVDRLGTRWTFFKPLADYAGRARFGAAGLALAAQGNGPASSSPLATLVGGERDVVEVEVAVADAPEAGLLRVCNDAAFCGMAVRSGVLRTYRSATRFGSEAPIAAKRVRLRIVNDADVPSFYYSIDDRTWVLQASTETAGFNTNVFGGFLSLRPAVFASGKGGARFRNFSYRELADASHMNRRG